jgi:hypothetical protein
MRVRKGSAPGILRDRRERTFATVLPGKPDFFSQEGKGILDSANKPLSVS